MPMLEDVKKIAEKVTGWSRPKRSALSGLIRERKAGAFRFKDDGIIPNHPQWPLVIYRSAVRLPDNLDPAAVFAELFDGNGWGDSWRDGIYDYVHYHSRIHEVLGIARGAGKVQFGGHRGVRRTPRTPSQAGDVAVLPAGHGASTPIRKQGFSGHRRLSAVRHHTTSAPQRRPQARPDCHPQVEGPRKDPVYGPSASSRILIGALNPKK
jgi:uncharacterized protein YjlB